MTTEIRTLAAEALAAHKEADLKGAALKEALMALPRTVTQGAMAIQIGVTKSHMSMLLAGKRGFGVELLDRIQKWGATEQKKRRAS